MYIKSKEDVIALLKAVLNTKEVKQVQLAEKLNITKQGLQNKLNAKNISMDLLLAIAQETQTNLTINFEDKENFKSISTEQENLINKLNKLNNKQRKLINDIIDNLI